MDDKRLRLGADTGELEAGLDRVRKKAEETFMSMSEVINKNKTSVKALTEEMERQAAAFEREITDDWSKERSKAVKELERNPDSKRLQRNVSELDLQRREDSKVVDELRRINNTLVETSRKEIQEDRKTVQETLANTPKEQWTLKQRLQAGMLEEDASEEARNKRLSAGGGGRGGLSTIQGLGSTAINSNNIADMGFGAVGQTGGMLSGAGFAGAGLLLALGGMLGKKLWDISMQYYKQAGTAYAMTGSDVNRGASTGMADYGFSAIDFASKIAPLARMRRSGVGVEQSVRSQLLFNKGIGLDENLYGQMDQMSVLEGKSGSSNIQSSIAAMKAAGIVKGGDMSPVNDYLQIIANASKEQVTRLGRIDVGVNTKMVAALSNLDEMLAKSPEALQTMLTNVRGGLTGGSQQSQALQYSVLSRMAPGSSMFDLMKMKEDPFSEKSKEFLPQFLDQLKSMSGGNSEQFYMNIMKQFNLSASMAEMLGKGHEQGNLRDIIGKNFEGKTGVDVEGRAEKATTAQEKLNAETTNLQVRTADTLVEVGDAIAKQAAAIQENNKEVRKLSDSLLEDSNFWKRLYGALIQTGQTRAYGG